MMRPGLCGSWTILDAHGEDRKAHAEGEKMTARMIMKVSKRREMNPVCRI